MKKCLTEFLLETAWSKSYVAFSTITWKKKWQFYLLKIEIEASDPLLKISLPDDEFAIFSETQQPIMQRQWITKDTNFQNYVYLASCEILQSESSLIMTILPNIYWRLQRKRNSDLRDIAWGLSSSYTQKIDCISVTLVCAIWWACVYIQREFSQGISC